MKHLLIILLPLWLSPVMQGTAQTSLLLTATRMNREGVKGKDLQPDQPFKLDVRILDITGDFATARTVNAKYGFFDYCHLAKFDGEWKILNVLWGWLPKSGDK